MSQSLSRRHVLKGVIGASAAIAAGASQPFEAAASARIPIIDTHLHLWDMKTFRPPWLSGPAEAKINRPETLTEYARENAGLNIVKAVYMEVDVAPAQQVEEAEWIAELCGSRRSVVTAAVVSARPASASFAAYAKRFAGSPYIKGVRQVLQVPEARPGLCLRPEYVRSIRLCGELGLSFDICIRPSELSDAAKLVDLCPHTRFILDHCGNASARNPNWTGWERDMTVLGKRKNVVCKVSGIIKTVSPQWNAGEELEPIVRHVIDSFGPDRVMFGSDWPVCNKTFSLRAWISALEYILRDASEADRRKLFHDNAARFYGLES